ncbi:MAG TPA: copper homeostasis protein CutC [Gemmataceae bacterium]|jgi:copper homeostasis protein|nr:copper homeostasis protein CutC [Gemmataceae bacterium]
MSILLEVCVASLDDALTVAAGRADRLELNSALELGGLTPSAGLVMQVEPRVRLPLIVMIRPRPGGFCYSEAEFEVMRRDAEWMIGHAVDGLAFGCLTPNGEVDRRRCRILRETCKQGDAVFHRAFDVTPDPFEALEVLIDLGFTRVMTSGQQASAAEGAGLIAELVERFAGRIEILPAAGINRNNVAALIARTGCRQIHASARGVRNDNSVLHRPQVHFGSTDSGEGSYAAIDVEALVGLRMAIDAID